MHGVWNMAIVGGILHIGSQSDETSMFNFVLEKKSFLISGGDFGIEASVISIIVYLFFTVLALLFIKNRDKEYS